MAMLGVGSCNATYTSLEVGLSSRAIAAHDSRHWLAGYEGRLACHIDLPYDRNGIYDSTLKYMGLWGVQITMARYLTVGWIDIGLSDDELPYLEWLADELESPRICGNAA